MPSTLASQRIEDARDEGSNRPFRPNARQRAVARTVGPQDPVRYILRISADGPRLAHKPCQSRPAPGRPAVTQADYFRSSHGIIRLCVRLLETVGSGPRITHGTQPTV
jgi:hypothetical protein